MLERISEFTVKIGGSAVSQDFMRDVLEIVVDSSLHIPSMFTILLRDPTFNWVENTGLLDIGKVVEIGAKTGTKIAGRSEELTGTLIKGEITALEPHFSGQGETSVLVRGYDKSHRLHRGKKTRTFLTKKDSELVSTSIAGEAGLTAEVDATTVTYDYILQNNQTNMEFLISRAQRIGYQVFAADDKLYFKKGDFFLGDGPTLTLGKDLLSFQPCYSATHQADKMIVKGWDPKGKAAISGEKTPVSSLNQGGMSETGGDKSMSAFGSAEAVVTEQPVFTVDEANEIATGLSNDISREFVEAEGVCFGHPAVKAGWKVDIQGIGSRFSGGYFVTSATHIWNEHGYETRFSISGRQPNTLSHLLDSGNGHGRSQGLVHGVVPAQVTNLNDSDNLGRVKVKYPWLGTNIESDWMRIATPMAGAERGFLFLPEVNDEILVAFEHGDINHPYMVGGLWSSTDKPPKQTGESVADGKVVQRVIKTRSGHIIILDDTQGSEQIIIRDKTEANEIVINSPDNSMTIKCDGDLTIETGGKFTVTSTGDMSFKSSANGKIEATQNMDIEATSGVNVKATGSVTVEGTSGATVKNAAGAEVALSGPTVNINKGALEVM